MIDVRRYCLPCSQRAGVLVERTVPSRDAERARTNEQRKKHEAEAREKIAAKRGVYAQTERGQLEAFARRALKLEAFETARVETFKIRLARARPGSFMRSHADGTTEVVQFQRSTSSSGHAYGKRRFVVTAGSDRGDAFATILHEIAHCAAGYEGGPHGDGWRSVFASGVHELTGETPSGMTHHDLHAAAIECVRRWLERNPS